MTFVATPPLRHREILGLSPWRQRLREAAVAIVGDGATPPSRTGLSSLQILQPRLAFALWRGKRPFGRLVPVYNLFNRTPTPEEDGWSLRKSQVCDFRGGRLTYDSHNATDFATEPGTVVVAAATGRVMLVRSEYNRGGLKLLLDHGDGLMTTYVHLARTLVQPGELVQRGQPVALSGASGLNFPITLFCDPPHLHFATWLNGEPVDPYARAGEVSLWRGGEPTPVTQSSTENEASPGTDDEFNEATVAAIIASCNDPLMEARLAAVPELRMRAADTIFSRNYYPTRFANHTSPYRRAHTRAERLDLPFRAADYDGATFELDPI